MSQPRPDLDNSLKKACEIAHMLSSQEFVKEIYLNGSRSPNSWRPAREGSDWDFICIVDKKISYYPPLRSSYGFHGDVIFIEKNYLTNYPQSYMIYPKDELGVLKNAC